MRAVLVVVLLLLAGPATAAIGVATPVEDPGHAGLARWYRGLRALADGGPPVRALHYGDSTIAADGIARTVRARLAERFGDAGPGFVPAAFDPQWHRRSDLVAARAGSWRLRTILFGGAGGRYGLGGIVGIADAGASVAVQAVDALGGTVPQRRFELWYQAGLGYGEVWAALDGAEVLRTTAAAPATEDRRFVLDLPQGYTQVKVGARGGPVPLYGVVMERGAPGITWEALGVVGVGSKSFTTSAREHLPGQVAQRAPDLVVVMLGGNEAGFPVLTSGGGAGYVPIFRGALDTIRAGAPEASCLVVSPLDQGYLDEEGVARSRPGMANLVARQREVAHASGCAFWSAWAAMGGAGSAVKWSATRGIGTGDLVHLTPRGLEGIAERLVEALLADYEAWAAATP